MRFNYIEITTNARMYSKQKTQNKNRKRQVVNYEKLPTFPQNLVCAYCGSLMPDARLCPTLCKFGIFLIASMFTVLTDVTERNLTKLCHMYGSKPCLKMDIKKWEVLSP